MICHIVRIMQDIRLVESTGDFGKFHAKNICCLSLVSLLCGLSISSTIFVNARPALVCGRVNETFFASPIESCVIWANLSNTQRLAALQSGPPSEQAPCHFDRSIYKRTMINEWLLVCERAYMATITQTSNMLGSIFGVMGGLVGDRHGRKKSTVIFSIFFFVTR